MQSKKKAGVLNRSTDLLYALSTGIISADFRACFLQWEMQTVTKPLTLIGPKGLERVVNALRVIAPELPFQIKIYGTYGNRADIRIEWATGLKAFRVNHNVTCYG